MFTKLGSSIGSPSAELGTGHFPFDPCSVERDSAIDSVLSSLESAHFHDLQHISNIYLSTAITVADITDEDVLTIALIGQRTSTVSLMSCLIIKY